MMAKDKYFSSGKCKGRVSAEVLPMLYASHVPILVTAIFPLLLARAVNVNLLRPLGLRVGAQHKQNPVVSQRLASNCVIRFFPRW